MSKENKNRFYSVTNPDYDFTVECFKLSDRDETKEPTYEIVGTNNKTGETVSLEAHQPQAAIALADEVMRGLTN